MSSYKEYYFQERMSSYEEYAFHVFYFDRGTNEYDVDITATPNIPKYIESVEEVYEGADKGSKVMASKITDKVSFILPATTNGWELTAMTQPLTLQKSTIEDYEPGKPVPHISMHLKLRDTSNPTKFMARVQITGVKPSLCVVTLSRKPTEIVPEEEKPSPQYKTVVDLKEEITKSLSDGPDQYLLTQFKLKGWLIGPGPDPDVPGMINVALGRIKSNVSDYDDFIGMLQEIPQAKDILETIMGMCPSTLSHAMLLTKETIMAAVKNVRDTDRLGDYLGVPERRWRQIKKTYANDRRHRLVQYIDFFASHCPMASWRMVIVCMDGLGETKEADKIRHLAETIQDSTLTIENLRDVTSTVQDWLRLGGYDSGLGVPRFIREQIRDSDDYKTEEEKKDALLLYFLKNVPMASWSRVAQALHYNEEETALTAVKKFLNTPKDDSFTPENLSKVLEPMSDGLWQFFGTYVYIPKSKLDTIKQECGSDKKCKEALIPLLVDSHPTPSWQLIGWGLYQTADDEEGDDSCLKSLENLPQVLSDDVLYKEAMAKGYAESGLALVILVGVTGSGKSEFKRLVLGQKVPKFSPSTPLAESAVRSLSVVQVAVDGVEWTIVGPRKMLNMVASTIKGEVNYFKGNSEQLSHLTSQIPSEYQAEEHSLSAPENMELSDETQNQVEDKMHDEQNEVQPAQEQGSNSLSTSFQEALAKQSINKSVLESMRTPTEAQQLEGINFIYLLDSGGQPPFREMLPHFVQEASAIVLLQKLNKRLDEKPTIRYREKGGKVDEGYTSQLTNEQILHQYVQGVQSHKSSKVFVIGTHRDKEEECNETREEKDKKLLEVFRPILGEQMELYKVIGNPVQLIFPVNSTSREQDDEAIAREFRKRVMEKCMGEKKKIPMPWFLLEQLLQSLSHDMAVSVFSIEECFEAARQKLSMTRNACQAALRYLGKLNIIFFRPDVLPGVVFASAQVILDKLTELVRCNHALRTERGNANAIPSYINGGNGLKFREYGLLNSELLEKAFPSHYREGLFIAPDLLLLLERMLIAGKHTSGEHFIPSLLPDLPVEKIAEYRATADHPPPLVIYYLKMWLPVGVMSSLVVYLQNECGWIPAEKRGTPTCMKHNCIEFELLDEEPGSIVLIDSVRFLEIHVKPTDELNSSTLQLLLRRIRGNVMTGLQEAHKSLHYNPPQTEFGFLCSGECGSEELHHATLVGGNKKWRCSEDNNIGGELEDKNKLWLKADSRTRTPSSVSVDPSAGLPTENNDILKEKPTWKKLMLVEYAIEGTEENKEFRTLDKISPHWIDIAGYLKIDEATISNASNARDQRVSARKVMIHWIKSNTKASWSRLIKAMKAVSELKVAAEELRTALLNAVSDSDDESDDD